MMDCTDITRFLHAYIDQEFEHREEIEFEHHLRHCDSCRQEVAYYRSLRRTLRAQVEREVAPVRLEARVMQALDHEERSSSVGWFSLSLATAGAFLCAMGIFLWTPSIQDISESRRHKSAAVTQPQPAATGQSSTVFAPLSVRASVPAGRQVAQVHQQDTQYNDHDADSHAARAILSSQRPQRCVEPAGWFLPADNDGQQMAPSHKTVQATHAANQLDDLCDPPQRRRQRLLRASFQR